MYAIISRTNVASVGSAVKCVQKMQVCFCLKKKNSLFQASPTSVCYWSFETLVFSYAFK